MALHLLYRIRENDRRADGRHACLVDAADEATARTTARVPENWGHVQLAAAATMPDKLRVLPAEPMGVIWIAGDAVSLLGIDRGGNVV